MIKEKNYDTVFHSQEHFRSVLDSMARPGKLNPITDIEIHPVEGLRKSTASVAFALINRDVSFQILGFTGEVVDYIKANRNTDLAPTEQADFIITLGYPEPESVEQSKEGILTYPETSASFICQIPEVNDEPMEGSLKVTLKGPGIPEEKTLFFKDADPRFFEALSLKNEEFPLGVDVIFTTFSAKQPGVEQVLCIPRSTQIKIG